MSVDQLINRYKSGQSPGDLFQGEAIPLPEPPPLTRSEAVRTPQQATAPPKDEPIPFTRVPSWRDPRPDLKADSALWGALLRIAEGKSDAFCGVLNGFRCGGTRIKAGKSGWVLRPDIDSTGRHAWESQEEYDELKGKFLKPYIDNGWLVEALKKLLDEFPLELNGVRRA